jgi:ABC-type polysaccharide/polyol phosphate transport system ATPase subunit
MPLPPTSDQAEPPVELRGVGVRYRLPRNRTRSIKEFSLQALRGQMAFDDFWALRDVDLRVGRGERLGVVGRNGAGKTTMLQVIARVVAPTTGTVALRGRVAPLLQLGAGFDAELTGRENVFLNGALLGVARAELEASFDWIVGFAALGQFIDAPLRVYSAGMVARLGFAVATAVRPDVLLVDELLAVGDLPFQLKSQERMAEFARLGTTMVIVTHDMSLLRQHSTAAIWVDGGRIRAAGPPAEITALYEQHLSDLVWAAQPPVETALEPLSTRGAV